LRNREAARYARWSAIAAGLIALAVAGVYAQRVFRAAQARHRGPKPVSVAVQQQSAQFSFSKVEQDRTIFTIRASHFTQYKDQDRAILQDVWITIYGRDGSRDDNVHTHECIYEPESGAVRCEGEVQIDLKSVAASQKPGKAPQADLAITTTNLSFNRNTGEASTPAAVKLQFPSGQGQATGAVYSAQDGIVRLQHDVTFQMAASQQTAGLPVTASGSSLEIRRNDRILVLHGPAVVKEGSRELSADTISAELDPSYHARHVYAEGHPEIRADEAHGKISIVADRFEGWLSEAGWVQSVAAEGHISGTRETPAGTDHFSAARVDFAMIPARNLIDEMTASGGVFAELHQGSDTHVLKTDAMRVKFASEEVAAKAGGKASADSIEHQRVESAETLAPATIDSKGPKDTMTLSARKFVAHIGSDGRLDQLVGRSGVQIRRTSGNSAPQNVTANEMTAKFDAHGEWETVDETGDVRFQQADRVATAARATVSRPTDTVLLAGSPVISDAMSRTTANAVTINQASGEFHANGNVISTYIADKQNDSVGLGSGAAHVSADSLAGSMSAGHVTYSGHARLWQGDSVLDSEQIQIWRDEKKLIASGHVVAVFPQASGPLASLPGSPPKPSASNAPAKPTLWKISALSLTYWADQGKAHLEGGVTAISDQGSLESRTLDAFLEPTNATATAPPGAAPAAAARQLSRVLAQGNVVVREGDRRGMAEQAEYIAADGKFTLSGGQPTLVNAASDTTRGRSLTFFVANDTILVDSQEGSRTVTTHRVEK